MYFYFTMKYIYFFKKYFSVALLVLSNKYRHGNVSKYRHVHMYASIHLYVKYITCKYFTILMLQATCSRYRCRAYCDVIF